MEVQEERARRAEPAIQSQGQSPRSSSSSTTTSPSTRRPFRYLEIGIMDGDNASAVWHMLSEVSAAHIAPGGHQHDKDDGTTSSSHADSHDKFFEIHLVDPFANATKSYFEQMYALQIECLRLETCDAELCMTEIFSDAFKHDKFDAEHFVVIRSPHAKLELPLRFCMTEEGVLFLLIMTTQHRFSRNVGLALQVLCFQTQ